ncbi:MAG: hypothetical protein NC084_04090 [Bacteroides sp.]|nr:hypothetical protein [Eubacterium sp.]MCM1417654.1 hypothetical protein [Roseburia sp.]MCM1461881.1 hypothetical protein [Bacteroides sp.]
MTGKILLVAGKSGTGKTTIVNELERSYGLRSVVSYTTRPRRSEDEQGHLFVTDQEFDRLNLTASSDYGGYRYGATEEQIEESDLYIVDVKGIEYLKEHYRGSKEPVVLRIVTSEDPSEDFATRYERMVKRGDGYEAASKRVALDTSEFRKLEKLADYTIVNREGRNIQEVCEEICEICGIL